MATTTIFDSSKAPSLGRFGIGQPTPMSAQSPLSLAPNPAPQTNSPKLGPSDHENEHYRLLTKGEWLQFCRSVGILKDEESEEVIRATSRVWPPSGFKDGLYSDILFEKAKFMYWYHILSVIRWVLMLLQLALSAVLTALGATSSKNGTAITTIAAINTSVAGILALMHNSGLPDRYRSDRNEFYKLEEYIKAIVDTGLVPVDHSVNDVLAGCFEMFQTALQTVQNNIPASYTPAAGAGKTGITATSTPARMSQVAQTIEPKK
ncbi:hypothetical protein F5Y19DRAFT_93748 [Xylariaceae sp. FL1651]|nr:hypothetical protein F5Y19DRAFT_93748 [Xylariaceae sp. FL1651]